MPRTRTTYEDCERKVKIIEGGLIWNQLVDKIMTEKDLMKMIEAKYGTDNMDNKKFPDCVWHRIKCTYIVIESKSSSISKALKQLENFSRNFPKIHNSVYTYIIEIEGTPKKLKRFMKLQPFNERRKLYKPLRNLGRFTKEWDINGKPLLIRII
ncbi:MAG: hypothetical protein GSR79_05050 [Desulfurococcales archaeon]|nr:hypothetical protein [Desulfurococcales archaeon]